ncbi:MAG: trehalose-phosphatase, partial [Acinetobacter sp.]|nr:trehalose-phosphatase [Acinetobacter sp.]
DNVADFLLLFQNRIKSLYVKNSQNQNGEKLCLN